MSQGTNTQRKIQDRGRLRVTENRRYLEYEDGTPFFYPGDTVWELFHRLDREEADRYLTDRAPGTGHLYLHRGRQRQRQSGADRQCRDRGHGHGR